MVGHYWYVLLIKSSIVWMEMNEKKMVMTYNLRFEEQAAKML